MTNAFFEYVEAERGRRLEIARALGVTPGAISQWTRVPVDRLVEVERITGIPRQKLRPDIFEGMS